MQLLDSIVTGALMLPDVRDQKDLVWAAVSYMASGEVPGELRPTAEAMLVANLPALANSRARALAGAVGGSRGRTAPKAAPPAEEGDDVPYAEIVSALNEAAGTHYKAGSRRTRERIRARWGEGFRLGDFQAVVRTMAAEWGDDAKMSAYLRPETLFGPKFESYLNRPARDKAKDGEEYDDYD
jgi:uncharacterized phage protein (TIGR02220 family)